MARTEIPVRMQIRNIAPAFMKAMSAFSKAASVQAEEAGLDPVLCELVKIRASQINGCAFCVDMHVADALKFGADNRQLHTIAVWHESPLFSERQRAALQFTDAVTQLNNSEVSDEDWHAATSQFNETEIAGLLALILAINCWNRIGVTTHSFVLP